MGLRESIVVLCSRSSFSPPWVLLPQLWNCTRIIPEDRLNRTKPSGLFSEVFFITMFMGFSASLTPWHGFVLSQLHLLAFTFPRCSNWRDTRGISLHVLQRCSGNTGGPRQENWRRNWFGAFLENTSRGVTNAAFYSFLELHLKYDVFIWPWQHLLEQTQHACVVIFCIFNQIIHLVQSCRQQPFLTA